MRKALADAHEDHIVATYFFEQHWSPRCWRTVEQAEEEFAELPSPTAKLEAVKEQILIRFLGLGIEEAHHPWSRDGHTFSADELFRHLVETVIPLVDRLEEDGKLPTKPPLKLPEVPQTSKVGTTSRLGTQIFAKDEEARRGHEERTEAEITTREARGEGDLISEKQKLTARKRSQALVGFQIKMRFSCQGNSGEKLLNWFNGKVIAIVSKKRTERASGGASSA